MRLPIKKSRVRFLVQDKRVNGFLFKKFSITAHSLEISRLDLGEHVKPAIQVVIHVYGHCYWEVSALNKKGVSNQEPLNLCSYLMKWGSYCIKIVFFSYLKRDY